MQVAELQQEGNQLTISDHSRIGYQYSSRLTIKLNLQTAGSPFIGLTKKIMVKVPKRDDPIYCETSWSTNFGIITLPDRVYEQEGLIGLSLIGFDDRGYAITTNIVCLYIDESNRLVTATPPPTELWEREVMETMLQYFDNTLNPRLNKLLNDTTEKVNAIKTKADTDLQSLKTSASEDLDKLETETSASLKELNNQSESLQTEASKQQEIVSKKVTELNTMLKNGDFDGATWLIGSTLPSASIGKNDDFYLNIVTFHLYRKSSNSWSDLGSIHGDNTFLFGDDTPEKATQKTLFIQKMNQAQAIVMARANEFDTRIPLNQINTGTTITDIGLDVYLRDRVFKTPSGMIFNYFGTISLKDEDLNDYRLTGSYYCNSCISIPEVINGYLIVISAATTTCKQEYRPYNSFNRWERYYVNTAWSDWKLVEGEVILWSGAASTVGTVLDLQHSIKRFGSFDIYIAAYCMHALVKRDVGDPFLMGDFIYLAPANTAHYIGTATLHCKTPTQMTLYSNALSLVHTIGQNHVKGTDYTITKILGRP